MRPTDAQIDEIAIQAEQNRADERATITDAIRAGIRAALALAYEGVIITPPRTPWLPVLEVHEVAPDDVRLRMPLIGTAGVDYFRAWRREHAEAAMLAMNWLPRAAAVMRSARDWLEHDQDRANLDALLAELDGWELPPAHTK